MLCTKLQLLVVMLIGASFVGCDRSAENQSTSSNSKPVSATAHVHGEWWCAEHGVPEGVCAQCDSKLVDDFKAKGDWCKEHDRPDSQCFICHPENEARFAAQYEAKYGEKPPKPEVDGDEHEHEDKAPQS